MPGTPHDGAPAHDPQTANDVRPPLWFAPASAGLVLAIGVLVGLRGFSETILAWGRPFWQVTYRSGLIRRGLVGSIFQGVYGGLPSSTQTMLIIQISLLVVLALLAGFATWLAILVAGARTRSHALRLTLLSLPIIGSALFPMLVFTVGYLDGILLLFAFSCTVLLARGHLWPAVCLASVAPFVHELFLCLWIPIAIFGYSALLRRGGTRTWRILLPALLVPFVSSAVVVLFSSRAATSRELALHVTGTTNFRAKLLREEFGQSIGFALRRMEPLHSRYWWPTEVAALGYYCWPAILAAVLYMFWRWEVLDRWAKAALVLAILSPWASLMVAWDLSRLILLANALVLMVILGLETGLIDEPFGQLRHATVGGLCAATAFAVALPFMYVYFDRGYYLNNGPLRWTLMPLLRPVLNSWFHLV